MVNVQRCIQQMYRWRRGSSMLMPCYSGLRYALHQDDVPIVLELLIACVRSICVSLEFVCVSESIVRSVAINSSSKRLGSVEDGVIGMV